MRHKKNTVRGNQAGKYFPLGIGYDDDGIKPLQERGIRDQLPELFRRGVVCGDHRISHGGTLHLCEIPKGILTINKMENLMGIL